MAPYISRIKDTPEKKKYFIGFPKGYNSIQDSSLIDDKNLSKAQNVVLKVDGVERRPGTIKKFDEGSGDYVYGSMGAYKKTTGASKYLRIANGRLQYLDEGSDVWVSLTTHSFSDAMATFVQARDKVFIYNGEESLRYYDFSTITEYTALTTPTSLSVTPTFLDTLSITLARVGDVATATTDVAHSYETGDQVTVSGADQADYNIKATITVIGEKTFTYAVANTPVTPATGTITCVSAGSESYSYEVSAFNANGETLACTAVNVTTGADDLSSDKHNLLDWTNVTSADGYNVYGRTATGFGRVFLATVYESEYIDDGSDTPTTSKLAPDANNTGGITGKYGCYSLDRQFVAGITEDSTYHPCRFYYSGTVQYIDSFVGGEYGGGWVDVYANDGGEIIDIKPYKQGVLIWKTNGLFRFYFTTTGLPAIVKITADHGGTSFWSSQEIKNDYMYVAQKENRIAVMTVGQQENYVGDSLRTNEVSIFFQDDLTNANRASLKKIASWKWDNKYGFSYPSGDNTENDRGYVLDVRFGGWVYWNGLPCECSHYSVYDNGTNVYLYGGSNADGYMIRMFETTINDNGSAFTSIVGTKDFNDKKFDVEKIYRNPVLWFKYITGGGITAEILTDGNVSQGSAVLSGLSGGIGLGEDLWGGFLFGDSMSESLPEATEGSDIPQELTMMATARSINFYLIDNTANNNWLFMGLMLRSTSLEGKPLKETFRVAVT